MNQSLNRRGHHLSSPQYQMDILNDHESLGIQSFDSKLTTIGHSPLKPTNLEIFQINMGKMCNQVCLHCHVDAGPERKEIMSQETMLQCLEILKNTNIKTVDLTGGAPEMNPHFRWFVMQLKKLGKHIIVRCNLTIILANQQYRDLPQFFRDHKINVVSSLPYFTEKRTDAQRGDGVFKKSIRALQMLNDVGYSKGDDDLQLDLVYNPAGSFLPGDQSALEAQFKKKLQEYGIVFNNLFTIANLPVSRFLEYLIKTKRYEDYMHELVDAYNPKAAEAVMCRNTLSVGWDGYLYDCDFNQMLNLKVNAPNHIRQFDLNALANREIIVNQHCYGCTAGNGSSCGGSTT